MSLTPSLKPVDQRRRSIDDKFKRAFERGRSDWLNAQ